MDKITAIVAAALFFVFLGFRALAGDSVPPHVDAPGGDDGLRSRDIAPDPVQEQAATPAEGGDGGKIDVCRYGSDSIEALETRFQSKALGKRNFDPGQVFTVTPFQYRWNKRKKVNEETQKLTGIPLGYTYLFTFYCLLPPDNQNVWFFHILENQQGIIELIDIYILYDDKDFQQRGENINASRYRLSDDIKKAIESIVAVKEYTRRRMHQEMVSGGFLFHKSCETEDTVSDIFLFPLCIPIVLPPYLALITPQIFRPMSPSPFPGRAESFYTQSRSMALIAVNAARLRSYIINNLLNFY